VVHTKLKDFGSRSAAPQTATCKNDISVALLHLKVRQT
jgi:hypothetical protein